MLVLTHEDDALITREGEDNAEAPRLANEIVTHELAARQLDGVSPQAQVPRLDDELGLNNFPAVALCIHLAEDTRERAKTQGRVRLNYQPEKLKEPGTIEAIRIGVHYQTSYGTLWKDGTYFPRGTRVMVAGLHLEQGFCVRFPVEVDGEPLETWEDWGEIDFLAEDGTVSGSQELSAAVLAEAREVLDDAEDGTHLHLHETED